MLVRLLPEQAAAQWDDIKLAVEGSLPPIVGGASDRMSNILTGILTDEITVWVSVEVDNELNNKITGILLTTLIMDGPSKTKSLLLYCLYTYKNTLKESWESGLNTIKKYAETLKCDRIVAYSDVESIVKFAKHAGADTRYTFISFPLK